MQPNTDLKKQVRAAMLNAGQNWFAHVYIAQEDSYDFVECVKKANQTASVRILREYVLLRRR